jgi:hypothetical protein
VEGMSRLVFPYAALGLLGMVVATVGTGGHRYKPWWGLVCVLILVVSASAFARAWKSWMGLLVFFSVWITIVLLLYFTRGPGNSVVVIHDGLGRAWLFGGIVAAAASATIPRRYLGEEDNGWRKTREWG